MFFEGVFLGGTADHFTPDVMVPASGTSTEAQALLCSPQHGATLPSFVLPPDALGDLRPLHGSCRKAGGPGPDVLSLADRLIGNSVTFPLFRPRQLFLTDDQVYADDVPAALVTLLTEVGSVCSASRPP